MGSTGRAASSRTRSSVQTEVLPARYSTDGNERDFKSSLTSACVVSTFVLGYSKDTYEGLAFPSLKYVNELWIKDCTSI